MLNSKVHVRWKYCGRFVFGLYVGWSKSAAQWWIVTRVAVRKRLLLLPHIFLSLYIFCLQNLSQLHLISLSQLPLDSTALHETIGNFKSSKLKNPFNKKRKKKTSFIFWSGCFQFRSCTHSTESEPDNCWDLWGVLVFVCFLKLLLSNF